MVAVGIIVALLLLIAFIWVVGTLIGLLLAIVVALAAGAVAEKVVGHSRGSILSTLLTGLLGALTGSIIAELAGMPRLLDIGGLPVVWTIIGAIIVAFVWQTVSREERDIDVDDDGPQDRRFARRP